MFKLFVVGLLISGGLAVAQSPVIPVIPGSGGTALVGTTLTATSSPGGGIAAILAPNGFSCVAPSFGATGTGASVTFSNAGFAVCVGGTAYQYLTSSVFRSATGFGFTNGDTGGNASDSGFHRTGLGAIRFDQAETGATGADLTMGTVNLLTSTAGTCTSGVAGRFQYTQGNASTKDIVQVCAHDATNTYAWRAIY